MQEHQFGGRKVHVTDIAHYYGVTHRHAFRIQADVKHSFSLSKNERITLNHFATYVEQPPEEVLQRLNSRSS